MSPCEVVNFVGVLTCAIADCVESDDQLELLGAIFVQLGDAIVTYSTYKSICCNSGDSNSASAGNCQS